MAGNGGAVNRVARVIRGAHDHLELGVRRQVTAGHIHAPRAVCTHGGGVVLAVDDHRNGIALGDITAARSAADRNGLPGFLGVDHVIGGDGINAHRTGVGHGVQRKRQFACTRGIASRIGGNGCQAVLTIGQLRYEAERTGVIPIFLGLPKGRVTVEHLHGGTCFGGDSQRRIVGNAVFVITAGVAGKADGGCLGGCGIGLFRGWCCRAAASAAAQTYGESDSSKPTQKDRGKWILGSRRCCSSLKSTSTDGIQTFRQEISISACDNDVFAKYGSAGPIIHYQRYRIICLSNR